MSNLTRWNPRRDMMSMNEALDRMFNEMWSGRGQDWNMANPNVDVIENDNNVIVKAELPGFKPEDVDIRVEGNLLSMRGEYAEDKEKHEGEYHVRERRLGSFSRIIPLPTTVNVDKANAEFDNGVLTLTLPKDEAAKPKRIDIKNRVSQR